jgi:hypothetical protein
MAAAPPSADELTAVINRAVRAAAAGAMTAEVAISVIAQARVKQQRIATASAEEKTVENARMVARYDELIAEAGCHFPGAVGKVARGFANHPKDIPNLARRLRRELSKRFPDAVHLSYGVSLLSDRS